MLVCRPLDLARTEHPICITIHQQAQQHFGRYRLAPHVPIVPVDRPQIQLVDDVHYEPRQVFLWQYLAHLNRLVQHRFVIRFLELSAHHSSLPLTPLLGFSDKLLARQITIYSMRRPRNYWTDFANVERELRAFIAEHGTPGVMPTPREMAAAGHSTLVEAIAKHGGQFAIAQRLNLTGRPVNHSGTYWQDFNNVERELRAFLAKRTSPTLMPTQRDFHESGRADLLHGIWLHGGVSAVAQ